jgi:hypothetical protein
MQMSAEISEPSIVVKSYYNVSQVLGLTREQASNLIGLNYKTLSTYSDIGDRCNTKQTEFQSLFILMYRSLFGLFGGDEKAMRHWFEQHNMHINGVPRKLCSTVDGLLDINAYLEGLGIQHG